MNTNYVSMTYIRKMVDKLNWNNNTHLTLTLFYGGSVVINKYWS